MSFFNACGSVERSWIRGGGRCVGRSFGFVRRGLSLGLGLTAVSVSAVAVSAAPSEPINSVTAPAAEPAASASAGGAPGLLGAESKLHWGSITLYSENDRYLAHRDRHYTNGFKLSFLSTDLAGFSDVGVPVPAQVLATGLDALLPEGRSYKLGISVGQNIYTPADTATTAFLPGDRPYAAWLYLGMAFQMYQPPEVPGGLARLDVVEVTAGMIGPSALGREIQNGFHDIIGARHAKGWDHQIHNEPGLNLVYERKWRWSTARARDDWGLDVIPHLGVSLGNIFTYANAGAEARLGYSLPADFGSNLIRPSGDSNARVRPPFSVFLLAGFDARAVARDATLEGNSFRDSPSVPRRTGVVDGFGGLGVGGRSWQLTYTQAYRSKEFEGQADSSVFGSVSFTFYY